MRLQMYVYTTITTTILLYYYTTTTTTILAVYVYTDLLSQRSLQIGPGPLKISQRRTLGIAHANFFTGRMPLLSPAVPEG